MTIPWRVCCDRGTGGRRRCGWGGYPTRDPPDPRAPTIGIRALRGAIAKSGRTIGVLIVTWGTCRIRVKSYHFACSGWKGDRWLPRSEFRKTFVLLNRREPPPGRPVRLSSPAKDPMASIERTAYPRLRSRPSENELQARYALTREEMDFVQDHARGAEQRLTLALMLKTRQHLGYFPEWSEIPDPIRNFVCRQLGLPEDTRWVDEAARKVTFSRYRQAIRAHLGGTVYGPGPGERLRSVLETAAQTMSDPADLINAAV